ncbi:MAG: alpha/beta fold hydrolase [Rhodospirillales bacterium]
MPGHDFRLLSFLAVTVFFLLASCTPQLIDPGPARWQPQLHASHFATRDGLTLPYRTWLPDDRPLKAVIVALHGFNDYSAFFDTPATYLMTKGIASYAYDQRGFGGAGFRGRWFATDRYRMDARDFTRAVSAKHPGIPLYILGESMGGAVAMTLLAEHDTPWIGGAILAAPAVWSREAMPWYQTSALWLATHTIPSLPLSGRGLNIKPSDNIKMLIALGLDPLVIKGTRVDAISGLVDLMSEALTASQAFDTRSLILYGKLDDIIKAGPTRKMLDRLPTTGLERRRFAVYPDGYHMLLRDLEAETVWADIAHWLDNPAAALPSGADFEARRFNQR